MPSTISHRVEADETSDAVLIKEIIEAKSSAFNSLVHRYKAKLFAFAFHYTRNEDASLDIVQECFLKVFEKAKLYDPKFAVSTWLYNITLNLCRDYKRRAKVRSFFNFSPSGKESSLSIAAEKILDPEPSAENLLSVRQQLNLLGEAIDGLPEDLKSALIMFHLEEQSQNECAKQLGISAKSVESRVYRARKILREKIEPR